MLPQIIGGKVESRHLAYSGLGIVFALFILPILFLFAESISYSSSDPFQSYTRAAQSLYMVAYVRSLYFGALTTIVTLTLSFVISYYLAFATKRVRVLLALIVIPLWIAYIIRYFGILLFLSPAGPLSSFLGVELDILFTTPAVIIGLANVNIPFAVLPIYNSLNSIEDELLNASRVLGAGQLRTIFHVILPMSVPGLIAAGLIVFILATGSFLSPAVLGGPDQRMIANLIAKFFLENYNVQFASALAVIYTALLVFFILVFNSVFNIQEVLSNL